MGTGLANFVDISAEDITGLAIITCIHANIELLGSEIMYCFKTYFILLMIHCKSVISYTFLFFMTYFHTCMLLIHTQSWS